MLKVTEEAFLRARRCLTEFVFATATDVQRSVGFTWAAVDDAPQDFNSLQDAYHKSCYTKEPLPVWSGASDATVYLTPEANHAFRFWHDILHCRHHMDFSVAGELGIASLQICAVSAHFGEDSLEAKLMALDTAGQVLYHMVEAEQVDNQLGYIRRVLDLE